MLADKGDGRPKNTGKMRRMIPRSKQYLAQIHSTNKLSTSEEWWEIIRVKAE